MNAAAAASDSSSDIRSVIIDAGSAMMKAGFSGHHAPCAVFPTVVGRSKSTPMTAMMTNRHFVGDDAQARRGILVNRYPVEHGIVTNWDDMELIWHHTFYNELRIDPEECNIFIAETPLNPKRNREKCVQAMFETFAVPKCFLANNGCLSLYATGRDTGLACCVGDGVTHVVPVMEGQSVPQATTRSELAGRDLTEFMMKLMMQEGFSFTTNAEREIVRDMKEKMCYVALDPVVDSRKASSAVSTDYELPDGIVISLGHARFRCPELLFCPQHVGLGEEIGIVNIITRSLYLCPAHQRRAFFSNIVLSGGSTMFIGMEQRLANELREIGPADVPAPKVVAPPERKYLPWIGGSILSQLSSFDSYWITKREYDEEGPAIVHKKCTF